MKNKPGKWLTTKFRFLKSMRLWIFILCFCMGLIPCLILSNVLLRSYEDRAVKVRTSDVSNQLRIISNHLIIYNYLQDAPDRQDVIDSELSQLSNLYDGRILIVNSDLNIIKDSYGMSEGKTIVSSEVVRALNGEAVTNYDPALGYIEIVTPIASSIQMEDTDTTGGDDTGDADEIVGVMLTSVSTSTIKNTQASLRHISGIFIIISAILILALALHVSMYIAKPFRRLTAAISDVKEGYTSDPVMVTDYIETERISKAFNQVYGRMKLLDDSRQEFVANVSHELKTPMTSMKVLADSLLVQEDVPAEIYRDFLGDITKEIDRENNIISDLLTLVKLDKTKAELNITQVDINSLIEVVLKRLRPIARKMDVALTFESYKAVTATVDEVKLSQVITNLVENAIKYNVEHGWVKVTLDADHQFFIMKVEDSGIGMDEESLNHIFERFYRVDKSHSREIGGTGLGLAITRSAVLMHRGSITVGSVPGEGTTFTVKIPLTYIAG